MRKILIVTATRAEYSIIRNIIKHINKEKKLQLYLIVTGSHLMQSHGMTINEIIDDKIFIFKKIKFKTSNLFDEKLFIPKFIKDISREINIINPNILLVTGDRLESYLSAFSAFINKIKIFHIHGGEITNGSIDNTFRYLISKLSDKHFVINKINKKRLIKTGENPNSIVNIKSLAIDNISKTKLLTKIDLQKRLGFTLKTKNILISFHPNTSIKNYSGTDFDNLLKAIANINKNTLFIFTYPNLDKGSQLIINKALIFNKKNSNFIIIKSLGAKLYYSTLKYFDLIIGNSSSAILEAPLFKINILNIGDRQKDRTYPSNNYITNCGDGLKDIEFKLNSLITKKRTKYKKINGNNSIKTIVNNITECSLKYEYKKFYEK